MRGWWYGYFAKKVARPVGHNSNSGQDLHLRMNMLTKQFLSISNIFKGFPTVFCNWSHAKVQVHSQHLRYKLCSLYIFSKNLRCQINLSAFQRAVKASNRNRASNQDPPRPEWCVSLILIVFPTLRSQQRKHHEVFQNGAGNEWILQCTIYLSYKLRFWPRYVTGLGCCWCHKTMDPRS